MRKILFLILIASLLPLSVAVAQTTPQLNPVVDYNGHPIEIEPDKGPVQGCVVKSVTTETLDGKTVATEGIILALNNGKWTQSGTFTDTPKSGAPGSQIEDCWHMEWDR